MKCCKERLNKVIIMTYYRSEPSWQRESVKTNVPMVDPLAIIYNEGQWKLNEVSPMYMVQYETVKLKQYATKIRQTIVSTITSNSSLKYTVKVEALPFLKYSSEDADGLNISVTSTYEGNSKTKVVYNAVLLSWGISNNLSDAVYLPYMLERGEAKIGVAVKSTLQTIFDCNIKQFSFTQQHLLQFGFMFLENDTSKDTEKFSFVFNTPDVDHKDKLTLAFNLEDVRIIWNGAKEEASNQSELVCFAYKLLQEQILHMVSLDITVITLKEIILPKAEIKSNAIIKMKTPELVHSFFTMLNEICNNKFPKEFMDVSS